MSPTTVLLLVTVFIVIIVFLASRLIGRNASSTPIGPAASRRLAESSKSRLTTVAEIAGILSCMIAIYVMLRS